MDSNEFLTRLDRARFISNERFWLDMQEARFTRLESNIYTGRMSPYWMDFLDLRRHANIIASVFENRKVY